MKSSDLFARAKTLMPGGVSSPVRAIKPYPFYVERAAGSHLTTVDGADLILTRQLPDHFDAVFGRGEFSPCHGQADSVQFCRVQRKDDVRGVVEETLGIFAEPSLVRAGDFRIDARIHFLILLQVFVYLV